MFPPLLFQDNTAPCRSIQVLTSSQPLVVTVSHGFIPLKIKKRSLAGDDRCHCTLALGPHPHASTSVPTNSCLPQNSPWEVRPAAAAGDVILPVRSDMIAEFPETYRHSPSGNPVSRYVFFLFPKEGFFSSYKCERRDEGGRRGRRGRLVLWGMLLSFVPNRKLTLVWQTEVIMGTFFIC